MIKLLNVLGVPLSLPEQLQDLGLRVHAEFFTAVRIGELAEAFRKFPLYSSKLPIPKTADRTRLDGIVLRDFSRNFRVVKRSLMSRSANSALEKPWKSVHVSGDRRPVQGRFSFVRHGYWSTNPAVQVWPLKPECGYPKPPTFREGIYHWKPSIFCSRTEKTNS